MKQSGPFILGYSFISLQTGQVEEVGEGRERELEQASCSSLSHFPFVIFKAWPHSCLSLLSIMHEPAITNHMYFLEGSPPPPVSGPVHVLFSLPGMFTLILMVLRNWWSPLGSSSFRKRSYSLSYNLTTTVITQDVYWVLTQFRWVLSPR